MFDTRMLKFSTSSYFIQWRKIKILKNYNNYKNRFNWILVIVHMFKQKKIWILDFHHSLVAEIVPSSGL